MNFILKNTQNNNMLLRIPKLLDSISIGVQIQILIASRLEYLLGCE